MPQKKSPQSLKTRALKTVTMNFEMLCYGSNYAKGTKALANYIHSEDYKDIEGPFADWPSAMLQDIISALYRYRCGHQHLLHCAIQPQLTQCSILQHGSMHVAMTMITERCSSTLRVLELNHSKNVPAGFYNEFFKKFRNLTKLSIFDSLVDDTAFSSIGEFMPCLVELNAGQTWITNNGIKHLCLDEEQQAGKGKVAVYRCPRLVILDVAQTRVTADGIALFVACHPNVVRINHEESFRGLTFARRQALQTKDKSFSCALTSLVSTNISLDQDEFYFAVDSCPLTEEVIILSAGLIDENLYRLMTLSRLTMLHLGNKNAICFNFYQGVAPVLVACGPTLQKLVLEDFTEIDVQQIGASCPRLEHLALSGTTTYAPIASVRSGLFRKLHKLELWNRNNRWGSHDSFQYSLCVNTLKQLLLFADLDFLLFYKVDTLTDQLFSEILTANPMKKLHNVILDHCQGISSATIWKLLEVPNELSVLRCWHCEGVPAKTRDEVKEVIKRENLAVYWEWFAFIENEDEIAAAIAAAELAEWEEE